MSEGSFIESDIDDFDPQDVERYAAELEREGEVVEDATVAYMRRRKLAYANVFTAGERTQGDIDIVLADLMWFCRARSNTFDPREGAHADRLSFMKEGRREVFYRIKDFSALDFDTILKMYTDAVTKQEK